MGQREKLNKAENNIIGKIMATREPADLDDHGQPIKRLYNRKRLNDRTIDELIGLSKGIVADGIINIEEAYFLQDWLKNNVSRCEDRIIKNLYYRIQEMLSDGIFDANECHELFDLLKRYTGETSQTSTLFFDDPLPKITFPQKAYCFTGKFSYGPRRICEEIVKDRGGITKTGISLSVDYLVVGDFISTDWAHTPYGRKIEKAIDIRDHTQGIAIIPENYWLDIALNMEK